MNSISTNLADYDLFDQGLPLESFAEIRKQPGLYWIEEENGSGFWAVTRHKDIQAVSRDAETFSSAVGFTHMEDIDEEAMEYRRSIIETDPPKHMAIRKMLAPFFTPRKVKECEDMIREVVNKHLDNFVAAGEGDWLKLVAKPIPIEVLCRLIGLPEEDIPFIIELTDHLVIGITVGDLPADAYGNTTELRLLPFNSPAAHALFEYGEKIRTDRRANPREDLATVLATGKMENGEELNDLDYRNNFQALVFAGNETTRTAMSHLALQWSLNPQEFAKVAADPSLIPSAIDEVLRVASPVIYMRRTATKDTELSGTKIKKGDKVITWFAAGNHDEAAFENPNQFRADRKASNHEAFGGGGIHTCLGAFLARLELRILLDEMVKRNFSIETAGDPVYIKSNFVNGIDAMPMRIKA